MSEMGIFHQLPKAATRNPQGALHFARVPKLEYAEDPSGGGGVRSYRLAALVVLFAYGIALSHEGRQQNTTGQSGTSQRNTVDAGATTTGNNYHSDYFNFTYHLPDGFVAGTEQYRQSIEKLSGVHSSADTFILLHAEQQLAPDAGVNGALTIMADRLSRYPKGATEKDYLRHLVTQSLKGQGDVLREGTEMTVSGQRFFRADYKVNGHGYQTVMLTFQRGFALSWTFMAASKADLEGIVESMEHTMVAK